MKNLFRKTLIAGAFAAAAGVAAALIFSKQDNPEDDDSNQEDEVNFIDIHDEDGELEEDVADRVQHFEQQRATSDEEREFSEEVNQISDLYPYLTKPFIEEQFNRNDVFNEQYPEDTLVTISHKAKFEEADTWNDFLAIAEANGYTGNQISEVEGSISKKMFTEDGAILSDIYNVANQVKCLRGVYEGYDIQG